MTNLYRDRYRISSARLASWDYSWPGMYFVTVCTWQHSQFFGAIHDGVMSLSEIGQIAQEEWARTPVLRPDMQLELDAFCIMPNHMHAILVIGVNAYNVQSHGPQGYGPQRKNLASIMRGYKSAVTARAHTLDLAFAWQSRYHDHIIRNAADFQRIQEYIVTNPERWQEDVFYM